MKSWILLVVGIAALISMAALFRTNPVLAAVPLIGLVAFIVLYPLYEKIRSLMRISAEFSSDRVSVLAESQPTPTQESGVAQRQVENQMNQAQTELSAAVDTMLAVPTVAVSAEVRQQVRATIDEHMQHAQRNVIAHFDLLLERVIFEYVLRGPAPYGSLIDHLTYVFYSRTDVVAKQLTNQYVQSHIRRLVNRNTLGLSQVGGVWYCYMVQQNTPPLAQDQSTPPPEVTGPDPGQSDEGA